MVFSHENYSKSLNWARFLDPVADKLMVAVVLVLLVERYPGLILSLPAAVIIGREITVSALREWMAELGARSRVAVSIYGKIKDHRPDDSPAAVDISRFALRHTHLWSGPGFIVCSRGTDPGFNVSIPRKRLAKVKRKYGKTVSYGMC